MATVLALAGLNTALAVLNQQSAACAAGRRDFIAQTLQLTRDRTALAAATRSQDAAVAKGDRVRAQLDALLSSATPLAQTGNTAAQAAPDTLARHGVTYTPPLLP